MCQSTILPAEYRTPAIILNSNIDTRSSVQSDGLKSCQAISPAPYWYYSRHYPKGTLGRPPLLYIISPSLYCVWYCINLLYIIKIEIHSSCEIEYFVETNICKLYVILRRAYYGLCVLIFKDILPHH